MYMYIIGIPVGLSFVLRLLEGSLICMCIKSLINLIVCMEVGLGSLYISYYIDMCTSKWLKYWKPTNGERFMAKVIILVVFLVV